MTLTSQPRKYALFIGRYQTLHEGHKFLFRKKIEEGIPVLVAIREMQIDEKNPYTPSEVMDLFIADEDCQKWFQEGMLAMMVIPDIEGVYYGRDVGYKVEQIEVPIQIADISATKIREQLRIEGKL